MSTPTVSFVIPTLNAQEYLPGCLETIAAQDYPAEAVEVVIADGGSTDATRAIAEAHDARVVENPGRTGEAGKSAGIAAATGEILVFVDSDNRLVGTDWLARLLAPFAEPDIVSSEVLRWEYVREDGLVNRYCALTGINDPASLFVGNYGRHSYLTGRWTDYPVHIEEREGWQRVTLDPERVPTMGANGYAVRAEAIRGVPGIESYMFDIDAVQQLARMGHRTVARVDIEIRHLFSKRVRDFGRKTRRRAQDFMHHRGSGERTYSWRIGGLLRFSASTVLVLPLLIQVARGMRRRPDAAWLFHPVACWMTLVIYVQAVVRARLGGGQQYDRSGWRQ
ncbi:MAG: glycosyltransferase [Miltoncostaeaceae bacterium]